MGRSQSPRRESRRRNSAGRELSSDSEERDRSRSRHEDHYRSSRGRDRSSSHDSSERDRSRSPRREDRHKGSRGRNRSSSLDSEAADVSRSPRRDDRYKSSRGRDRSSSRDRNRDRRRHRRDRHRHKDRSEKRGHRHPDRSEGKSTEDKSHDMLKGIDAVKARMRSGIDSARSEFLGLPVQGDSNKDAKVRDYELSVTEAVSRHRDIERIEEGSFRPSVFESTAGGAGGRVKKEDPTDRSAVLDKKQDAHDKAMFGPKWRDPVVKKESEDGEDRAPIPVKKEIDLMHSRFCEDPRIREARWLKLYLERRAQLFC